MNEGQWTALATVAIALINMVGSVLLQWIRAAYHVPPTEGNDTVVAPPVPAVAGTLAESPPADGGETHRRTLAAEAATAPRPADTGEHMPVR